MSLSTRRPAAGRSTGPSFFSFALAAAVLLSLVSSASALPTLRQARDAVEAPESLFRRAAPHVGPVRPVERLRLRRNLESVPHGRRNAENASLRPAVPVTAGAVNPKRAKRDDVVVVDARASNPKVKRASVVRAANPKAKRAVQPQAQPEPEQHFVNIARRAAGLPAAVLNPKKRSLEKRAVVEATISVSTSPARAGSKRAVKRSLMDRVRRFLAARATSTDSTNGSVFSPDVHRMILAVPNPKSPNFPGNGGGSSSSSVASSTTTSRASSTTSTPASTTTSKPVTTTTSKPVTTTTTTTSAVPSATVSPDEKMLSGAYYPSWVIDTLPPSKINYAMFDIINFAFAIPTSDGIVTLDDWSGSTLVQVVQGAHAHGTKVALSIGGWTDSTYFSSAVASSSARTKFVNSIVALVQKYNLDGVDIDWEYPGTQGNAGNQVSSSDTQNMLSMLQLLRQKLPTTLLSTCTTQQTYVGANGNPVGDVSQFANVLDHVMVMNYDVWGASSTPGPNAPLSNACPNSLQPNANMVSAIATWEAAGMPKKKILMGVPGYGYVSSSKATSLIHKRDDIPQTGLSNRHMANLALKERNMSIGHRAYLEGHRQLAARKEQARLAAKREKRRSEANEKAKRGSPIFCPGNHSGLPCPGVTDQNITDIHWNPLVNSSTDGTIAGPGGVFSGSGGIKVGTGDVSSLLGNQIGFNQMINSGVIAKDSKTLEWVGVNGYTVKQDSCSSTPFVYNQDRSVVITYDDPHSLGLKGAMARDKGIAGVLMWEMSHDTSDFQLVQSYRNGMGLNPLGN
ncbi:glycoside hydrolase [Rhodotorula sp. JG-1b]|nr:glycoside hydrolase [Rhodotorula sp. JG-1b]